MIGWYFNSDSKEGIDRGLVVRKRRREVSIIFAARLIKLLTFLEHLGTKNVNWIS